MIIDIHCHIAPPKWAETKPFPRSLIKIEEFFTQKAQAGVTLSVISNPMMNIPGTQQNDLELDMIREYEDFAQEIMETYVGQVVTFLGINPFGGQKVLYELEKALSYPGFKGVMVNSSVNDHYLDSPQAADFWALVGKRGIPVFLHPPALPPGSQSVQDYRLVENVARWNDITMGLAAIIFAGILEKYPSLSLICAMAGGGLGLLKDRLDVGYQHKELIPKNIPAPIDHLSQPPSAVLKQIYVDTCTYSATALSWLISILGSDHLLLGSDVPPSPTSTQEAIHLVQSLPVGDAEKAQILGKNAAQLLHLEEAHGG